jgi:hypothetical protein
LWFWCLPPTISVPIALGMKWLNIKEVSIKREEGKSAAGEQILITEIGADTVAEREKVVI